MKNAPQQEEKGEDDVLRAVNQVLEEVRRMRLGDDDLWAIEEIASYLKYDRSTVRYIVSRPDFPAPYIIPSDPRSDGGGKRYKAGEVKAWATRFKKRG